MKLDVLRRYRLQAEEYLRLELTEADVQLGGAIQRQAQCQGKADGEVAAYLETSRIGLDVAGVAMAYQAWEAADAEAHRAEATVDQLTQAREEKQAELAVAIRERKQIELLVERRRRDRQSQIRRREQRELDDFANGRWAMAQQEWTRRSEPS